MKKNIEKEYKILLTKEQFEQLCSQYPNLSFQRQVNTYYDTSDFTVRAHKGAMRIREKNGHFIFTLKMHSEEGLLEYECETVENTPDVFHKEDIHTLLTSYGIHGPVHCVAQLTTNRAVVNTGYAELCFDISQYSGHTDYEIEYEYLKEHDGLTCFQKILEPIGVTYTENCASKIQRAMACDS